MNIDDLYDDISEYEEEGEQELANVLNDLAYAWENGEDINKEVARFMNNYPDYQIPNFIDWDYATVIKIQKEMK